MTLADERFVICDVETFGLNPDTDPILEVGFLVCTKDFQVVAKDSTLVWQPDLYDHRYRKLDHDAQRGDRGALAVLKMHDKSNLWDDARDMGLPISDAIEEMMSFLITVGCTAERDMADRDPMVGSTIDFDRSMFRAQMPQIDDQFHYRSVNVSTLKELCRRYSPTIYSKMNTVTIPNKHHRVLSDCTDTMNELKFYVENFLWTES